VLLCLPRITNQQYRDEKTFWASFEQARPAILGALLDIVATALTREADVQLTHAPRMADFARWAVAAEAACSWPAGTFMSAYDSNCEQAAEATLDGDPVADLARTLVKTDANWTGTASDLLKALNAKTPEPTQRQADWFTKPRQVGDELRRLAPALRHVGIDVRFVKVGRQRTRTIELEKFCKSASAASARADSLNESGRHRADEPALGARARDARPTGRTDAEELRERFAKSADEKQLNGGPDRDRTGDLMNAIHARSQLRYWPTSAGETAGRDR
jgi:hypothetical protein